MIGRTASAIGTAGVDGPATDASRRHPATWGGALRFENLWGVLIEPGLSLAGSSIPAPHIASRWTRDGW
jgi:hypothetical protein